LLSNAGKITQLLSGLSRDKTLFKLNVYRVAAEIAGAGVV
jgi:hypothetical protein